MSWRTAPEDLRDQAAAAGQADLVIVGLGYAGTAAARAAAEAGASVIALETMEREKYSAFGRDIGHINSAFLRSRNIPAVEPTELFDEWMRRAGNRADPELVMRFCRESGETFDWFTDMYGLEGLSDVHIAFCPEGGEKFRAARGAEAAINGYHFWYGTAEFPDPMGWPGGPTLTDCARANQAKAAAHGARLEFGMTAVQLVKEDGRITGVIARDNGGELRRYDAKKAVLLAAGDFSRDGEMVRELCCDQEDILTPGQPLPPALGRRGDGVRMGVWAGGRLEARPLPSMGGNIVDFPGVCTFGSLWLGPDGKRFCNEVFGGTELRGFAGNQRPRGPLYSVFDEHVLEHELQWAPPCHQGFDANTPGAVENLKKLFSAGDCGMVEVMLPPPIRKKVAVYTGSTPEELAANAGLTGELGRNVADSIRRYNELCAGGKDLDFGRDPKLLDPLTGRLYLQIAEPMSLMLVTVGGLVTDGRQQVLDQNYQRIPGLYASGNCCGRRFGTQYSTPISGVSIGMAITLGRAAGLTATEQTE